MKKQIKKNLKKYRFEKKENQIWHKKKKKIIRDEIEKQFQLKKRIRTTKNNNKKIRTIFDIKIKCQWMKFKDKLFNNGFKTKNIIIKKIKTKFNIKTTCIWMQWKKIINLINDPRPNTLQLKEWEPNLI